MLSVALVQSGFTGDHSHASGCTSRRLVKKATKMYDKSMDVLSDHYRRKVDEILLLQEISTILDKSTDERSICEPVLNTLGRRLSILRGSITLLNQVTGEIAIEAAYGLSEAQKKKGRYKIGEGITGTVLKEGQPIAVPKVSEDPRFLNRTEARDKRQSKETAFICVPIKTGKNIIGTLSIDRLFSEYLDTEEDVRLLSIVASMISRTLQLLQKIKEEEERRAMESRQEGGLLMRPANIIGNSRAMQEVYELIQQVSKSDATVLIRGESGTGKELVAQAIHQNSLRKDKPFIKVNCAALPESIIESELFGHEKGAFTGALTARLGRFERAHNGTIFLDEIGDLSPTIQVKLLRVLQEREFERVGGNETIKTNVRIIAATNRNLETLMAEDRFREDLYYRLNVFPIHIPPLRDRRSDITLLADYFAEKYGRLNNKPIKRISTPAIDLLSIYHWPGNVRELENCIERAVLLSTDGVIHGHHLPPTLQSAESTGTGITRTLRESLQELERDMIQDALKQTGGNMAKAARILGITERIMGLRITTYRIDPDHYKAKNEK